MRLRSAEAETEGSGHGGSALGQQPVSCRSHGGRADKGSDSVPLLQLAVLQPATSSCGCRSPGHAQKEGGGGGAPVVAALAEGEEARGRWTWQGILGFASHCLWKAHVYSIRVKSGGPGAPRCAVPAVGAQRTLSRPAGAPRPSADAHSLSTLGGPAPRDLGTRAATTSKCSPCTPALC